MSKMKIFFDSYSKLYRNPAVARYFKGNFKWIINELPDKRKIKLLDIGCGTGDLIYSISKSHPDWQICGIDISTCMLKQAQEKNSAFVLCEGNVHQLPYKENMFDIVTNVVSFHHYEKPEKALNEMYRILKPGGILFLIDSIKDPRCISILPWYWDYVEKNKCYTNHLNLKDFRRLFEISKFTSVRIERKYRLWPVVHILCIAKK
jgi:Methylase involved in ubiquinone/menaquinone biosynthesis